MKARAPFLLPSTLFRCSFYPFMFHYIHVFPRKVEQRHCFEREIKGQDEGESSLPLLPRTMRSAHSRYNFMTARIIKEVFESNGVFERINLVRKRQQPRPPLSLLSNTNAHLDFLLSFLSNFFAAPLMIKKCLNVTLLPKNLLVE